MGRDAGEIEEDGDADGAILELEFRGELWQWRGPAPYYFITVPAEPASLLHALSPMVTYGWGMIPVTATIGRHTWSTALWPKDGRYVVPIRKVVRVGERLNEGDDVSVRLRVGQTG